MESTSNGFVGVLGEAAKQSHDGLEVGHTLDAEYTFENGVVAGDFAMLKTVGSAPYREHELGDELLRCVAAVGAGLRQARKRQRTIKSHVIEHSLQEAHTAPGGDFFVRKTQLKVHGNPTLKSRFTTLTAYSGEDDRSFRLNVTAAH